MIDVISLSLTAFVALATVFAGVLTYLSHRDTLRGDKLEPSLRYEIGGRPNRISISLQNDHAKFD